MTLDTKLISEDGWSRFAKDHKLDRNRYSVALQKALTRYDEIEDEEPGDAMGKSKQSSELLKQAPIIQATIAQLMKEKEVATSKDILKTLGEIKNYWAMKEKLLETETDRKREAASLEEDKALAAEALKNSLLDRLVQAAQSISGPEGKRLQKIMAIAKRGESTWKSLWFYNYEAVGALVEQPARYAKMTKATNGKLPLKGDTDGWGEWVIYPFSGASLRNNASDKELVNYLKWLDGQIKYSINAMGKSDKVPNDSVEEFYKHFSDLAHNHGHLYSAYN